MKYFEWIGKVRLSFKGINFDQTERSKQLAMMFISDSVGTLHKTTTETDKMFQTDTQMIRSKVEMCIFHSCHGNYPEWKVHADWLLILSPLCMCVRSPHLVQMWGPHMHTQGWLHVFIHLNPESSSKIVPQIKHVFPDDITWKICIKNNRSISEANVILTVKWRSQMLATVPSDWESYE